MADERNRDPQVQPGAHQRRVPTTPTGAAPGYRLRSVKSLPAGGQKHDIVWVESQSEVCVYDGTQWVCFGDSIPLCYDYVLDTDGTGTHTDFGDMIADIAAGPAGHIKIFVCGQHTITGGPFNLGGTGTTYLHFDGSKDASLAWSGILFDESDEIFNFYFDHIRLLAPNGTFAEMSTAAGGIGCETIEFYRSSVFIEDIIIHPTDGHFPGGPDGPRIRASKSNISCTYFFHGQGSSPIPKSGPIEIIDCYGQEEHLSNTRGIVCEAIFGDDVSGDKVVGDLTITNSRVSCNKLFYVSNNQPDLHQGQSENFLHVRNCDIDAAGVPDTVVVDHPGTSRRIVFCDNKVSNSGGAGPVVRIQDVAVSSPDYNSVQRFGYVHVSGNEFVAGDDISYAVEIVNCACPVLLGPNLYESWLAPGYDDDGSSSVITATPHRIQDGDNDTSIDVETTADEDVIRARANGTEVLVIAEDHLEHTPNGTSVLYQDDTGAFYEVPIEVGTGGTTRARLGALGLELANASDIALYSGAFSGLVGAWDGATGHIGIAGPAAALQQLTTGGDYTNPANFSSLSTVPTIKLTVNNSNAQYGWYQTLTFEGVSGTPTQSGIVRLVYPQLATILDAASVMVLSDVRIIDDNVVNRVDITTLYHHRINNVVNIGGTVANQIGLYIANMTAGSTLNRAIQSLGGISTHLGAFSIGHNNAPSATAILDLLTAIPGVGLLIPSQTTANAPVASGNGTLWYDSTTNKLRGRENGADVDIRGAGANHNLLDGSVHPDTLAGSVLDGDIIIGNVTPKWSRLGISVPAGADLLNILGVINGETRPSYKALFDATNPAAIGTASPGTGVVAAHRNHVHAAAAAQVTIADAGALIAATDVEGALQELASTNRRTRAPHFIMDGGGSALTTGIKGDMYFPFACTIIGWTLLGYDTAGAIVIDLWLDTYANYPPTVADTITASAKPTITASGVKGQSSTLTGWTTAIAAGQSLRVNIDSVATLTRVSLILEVRED